MYTGRFYHVISQIKRDYQACMSVFASLCTQSISHDLSTKFSSTGSRVPENHNMFRTPILISWGRQILDGKKIFVSATYAMHIMHIAGWQKLEAVGLAVPASALSSTLAGSPSILIVIMKLSISIGKYEVPHQFVNHNSSDLNCEGCTQLGRMMPSTPHTQDKSQKDDLPVPGWIYIDSKKQPVAMVRFIQKVKCYFVGHLLAPRGALYVMIYHYISV